MSVELTNESIGELIYCYRVNKTSFKAPVYSSGTYTLRVGEDLADKILLKNILVK